MADLKDVSTGTVNLETPAADRLDVDNIRIDGNTISSTDTNGDITLSPNGTGAVGIGTASPAGIHSLAEVLEISGGDGGDLVIGNNSSGAIAAGAHIGAIAFKNIDSSTGSVPHYAGIRCESADTSGNMDLRFYTGIANLEADTPQAMIDSSGTFLFAKTAVNFAIPGAEIAADGRGVFTRDSNTPLFVNRETNNGVIIECRKDNSNVGRLVRESSGFCVDGEPVHAGIRFGSNQWQPRKDGVDIDNTIDLGSTSFRFDDIFATNQSISNSDQNEKQNIASLTTAEITAAKAISKLFKTFKWKHRVAEKGDAARTHTGVIAQEVQTVMSDAGLNPAEYAFWCSNTWWEVEETYTKDDGKERTRIDTYDTAEEAPEGATQRTQLSIRYAELLAFIGAATEQRLADIETRLTALEDA